VFCGLDILSITSLYPGLGSARVWSIAELVYFLSSPVIGIKGAVSDQEGELLDSYVTFDDEDDRFPTTHGQFYRIIPPGMHTVTAGKAGRAEEKEVEFRRAGYR